MLPEIPLVSVVIPAYNAEATIVRAIESVFAASESAGIAAGCEVLVIDDGSQDGTSDRVRDTDHSVRLLHHPGQKNRGVSASRNLGIAASASRYVSFLDGDDTFCANRFQCIDSILEQDPSVDAVYGETVVVIEDDSQNQSWEDGQYFGVGERCTGPELLTRLIHSNPWATSAITTRRELFKKTGVFNEELSIAEDCHLWMRMAAVGKVVPDGVTEPVSVYHRQAQSLYRAGVDNKWHYSQALRMFYRWVKEETDQAEMVRMVRREITDWLDNTFIQLRSERRTGTLLKMMRDWLIAAPELTARSRNVSHALHALAGR